MKLHILKITFRNSLEIVMGNFPDLDELNLLTRLPSEMV